MKKIIAIVSACVVAVLLAVTVVLACTKFTAFGVVKAGANYIEVYRGGSTEIGTFQSSSKEYSDIMKLYNESLKENNLSSLFQGVKGFDVKVENKQNSVSNITNNSEGKYVLNFIWEETQVLQINGKDYVNPDSNTAETVKYNHLYVEVINSVNYTEYKVYLVDYATSSSFTTSYWYVSVVAHQSNLYSYIANL